MKKRRSYIILLAIGLLALQLGCVKSFDFEEQEYERILVVSGTLTNEQVIQEVFIGYTFPISELGTGRSIQLLSGAEVWVEDSDNNRYDYVEQDGMYRSEIAFGGIQEESYSLHFIYEGKEYRSTAETLLFSPPIQDIYPIYSTQFNTIDNITEDGILIALDTEDPTGQANYFRFTWEEAWQINVPFPSLFGYEEENDSLFRRLDEVGVCFGFGESSDLIIGSSVGNDVNKLIELPLRFFSETDQQLRDRYAITVKQYAISANAFSYLSNLKKVNEGGGTFFDRQVGTVTGNMISVSDPSETVLGYFEVAGVSWRRKFFSLQDVDSRYSRPPYRFSCGDFDRVNTIVDSVSYFIGLGDIYRVIDVSDNNVSLIKAPCADCSVYATTEPPDYWN